MSKDKEIGYIDNVVEVEGVGKEAFVDYLFRKPFSDPQCGSYLMDLAQVMNLLPPPPARVLDVGVGSGWTSELLAQRGYAVVGIDISPDMIALANRRARPGLSFEVCDYELGPVPGGFQAAVIYDSLHHSEDTFAVIRNIHEALVEGGVLVTVEPGFGHSTTPESIEVMRKFGTTEKDMPASWQRELMHQAGFGVVKQYLRFSQLPLEDVSSVQGALRQVRHKVSLAYQTSRGHTSIVQAVKTAAQLQPVPTDAISRSLLELSALHDKHAGKS